MAPEFHKSVPKDVRGNLEYRRTVNLAAAENPWMRAALRQACEADVLFFVNTFCWTLDPRKLSGQRDSIGSKLPFITWDYQDETFLKLEELLHVGSDGLIEKSRDMGASWITCTWYLWRWLYRPLQSFLMVSRKESLVDGDDDSLFAHIDFLVSGLPSWLLPRAMKRNKLFLKNFDNGSVIEGESNTDDIGRGGRRTSLFVDELPAFEGGGFAVLSATADNTRNRIFNGTPQGTANAFYAQRQKGTPRIRMHWSRHPEKRLGLYRPAGVGRFEYLDALFDYSQHTLVDDVPRGEEGVRSPWYDRECARRAHAWEIAQELDIDYQGAAFPFFDPRLLDRLRDEFCREPVVRGHLVVSGEPGSEVVRFQDDPKGPLALWCRLDADGFPPCDRDYGIGCDVSQGTGASDSVATVIDRLSGEKVGELVGNTWAINIYAGMVNDLGTFFRGQSSQAELIWEATGPGRTFGKIIVEQLKYKRFYYHKDDTKTGARPSTRYGWYSGLEGKKDLLQNYRELLTAKRFINPSKQALVEAGFYVFESGRIEFRGPTALVDPSNHGANHGDRVIADALCAKLLFEWSKSSLPSRTNTPPVLSVGARMANRRSTRIDERFCVADQLH